MRSSKSPRSDREKMFSRLRIEIAAVATVLVAVVLVVMFSTITFVEYTSKLAYMDEQLVKAIQEDSRSLSYSGSAVDDAFSSPHPLLRSDDGDSSNSNTAKTPGTPSSPALQPRERQQRSTSSDAFVPVIGGSGASYAPIITYRVDYDNGTLVDVDTRSAKLGAESIGHLAQASISAGYEFELDSQTSVCFRKQSTPHGDLVAFSDASGVQSYIASVVEAFVGVLLLVSASLALVAWVASKWIIQPVADAWERQRRFVADASHELKTPISVIIANSSILLESADDPDEVRQWTSVTMNEAGKLQDLVADMLELATSDTGKVASAEPIDFGRLVALEASQFEARAFEKRNMLVYDDIEDDVFVEGDKGMLERLVGILVDNACKYSHTDGEISVRLTSNRKSAVLTVSDRGEQIPADKERAVFDRFFRLDESRTGNEGYGLGLAMAKDIVEKHGGTISARTGEDGITVFTVELPKTQSRPAKRKQDS